MPRSRLASAIFNVGAQRFVAAGLRSRHIRLVYSAIRTRMRPIAACAEMLDIRVSRSATTADAVFASGDCCGFA